MGLFDKRKRRIAAEREAREIAAATPEILLREFAAAKSRGEAKDWISKIEKYFPDMSAESASCFSGLRDEIEAETESDRAYWRRYNEARADAAYQIQLSQYYDLITHIKERYTVINNVGSFSDEAGDKLVADCVEAINLETSIREKREYYENYKYEMSEPSKTLAMVYEKRGDYQRAAAICALAIENGYTADGTKGGMRGRLARMIKKGDLPLTENFKELLNL